VEHEAECADEKNKDGEGQNIGILNEDRELIGEEAQAILQCSG